MASNDITSIKTALKISEVIGASMKLTRDGREYKALCPFHAESTPSFTVSDDKGFYHCHGCGAHGDVIDWCQHGLGMEKREAIAYARSLAGLGEYAGPKPARVVMPEPEFEGEEAELWQPITPVPDHAPPLMLGERTNVIWNVKRAKASSYTPSHVWPYRDQDARLLGYVIRYAIDGKKITPQITYCRNRDTGEERWCVRHFDVPRPLYGLDLLAANPSAPVVLVEGEKAADAARELFPKAVCITWPGGSKGLNKVAWAPLQGRNVVMWPDADMPGAQAAWGYMARGQLRAGIQQLIGTACRLVIIDPPIDAEKGWDAADAKAEGWDSKRAGLFLNDAVQAAIRRGPMPPLPDPLEPPPQAAAPAPDLPPAPDYDGPPQPDYGEPDYDVALKPPFTALGHYKGVFYYLPSRGRQVIEMQAMAHRELNMLQLAPLDYWESTFPSRGGQSKVDWKLAADACMRACYTRGFFDPKTAIRGRGAWLDQGRAILHLGESLICDGVKMPPHIIESRYTYQADHSVEIMEVPALGNAAANRLVQICKQLSWEHPRSAILLSGFCVIAPVCGILPWRPHIWITGGAGSGKTSVLEFILKPAVGPIGLNVASTTTESGIRQELGSDARPVIFDEAESEDKQQAARIQAVLDLCRAASAESGAKIIKGTAGHDSRSFQIRSCFAFSSINTAVKHYADETRVTMLVLRSNRDDNASEADLEIKEHKYQQLKAEIINTLTPDYCAGLLMRTLEHLPTLRANIDTFVSAASVVLGSRRAADQLAPMLAGAYLLHSSKRIGYEEAMAWLRDNDMSEATAAATAQDDETRLFQYLMGHRLRVQTTASMGERTVGELIDTAYHGDVGRCGVAPETADAELLRFGIKVVRDLEGVPGFFVSTTSPEIKRALLDQPWSSNWARPLRMMQGAISPKSSVRFSAGQRARAIFVPMKHLDAGPA